MARAHEFLRLATVAAALAWAAGVGARAEVNPECRWSKALRAGPSVSCPSDAATPIYQRAAPASPAAASTAIPDVNFTKACEAHALVRSRPSPDQADYSATLANCLKQEIAAYDYLPPLWDRLSERGRRKCLAMDLRAFHYTLLVSCAQGQIEIDENLKRYEGRTGVKPR